ncbi:hypothetical protein DFH08DRAFT_992246 [Mycena albidolilacea]|uniref:Uncharacterized protein n=1 Tax=Mycena albidolilacea TaxID=1033008 RepID=A0AAD6YYX2_9AGAR|nr:hypothetical protein DFH08DRAFT_992246 [Mycena albidolilacea]
MDSPNRDTEHIQPSPVKRLARCVQGSTALAAVTGSSDVLDKFGDVLLSLLAVSVAGIFFLSPHPVAFTRTAARDFQRLPISCPTQHPALAPAIPFSISHKENVYVKRLQGAVQMLMETFDGAAQEGDDPWYDKFYELKAYPLEIFPDASQQLSFFACLTDALRDLHIQSSNTLRHETVERWTHRPFEGHVDREGWVWGRGAEDCKNTLFRLSLNCSMQNIFPKRTFLLAFGFDDEGGAVSFLATWTKVEAYANYFGRARVALATGSVNIKVSVNVPGVHSSVPTYSNYSPPHTAGSILSTLIPAIEPHPPPVRLSAGNPFSELRYSVTLYSSAEEKMEGILTTRTGAIESELKRALKGE